MGRKNQIKQTKVYESLDWNDDGGAPLQFIENPILSGSIKILTF